MEWLAFSSPMYRLRLGLLEVRGAAGAADGVDAVVVARQGHLERLGHGLDGQGSDCDGCKGLHFAVERDLCYD